MLKEKKKKQEQSEPAAMQNCCSEGPVAKLETLS